MTNEVDRFDKEFWEKRIAPLMVHAGLEQDLTEEEIETFRLLKFKNADMVKMMFPTEWARLEALIG